MTEVTEGRIHIRLGNRMPMCSYQGRMVPMKSLTDDQLLALKCHPARKNLTTTDFNFPDSILEPEFVKLSLTVPNDPDNEIYPTVHDLRIRDQTARLPEEHKKYAMIVHHLRDLWPQQSASANPTWVQVIAADPAGAIAKNADGVEVQGDQELQDALAQYFGCVSGEPRAIIVNSGIDHLSAVSLVVGSQPAAAGTGCLSANATTPSAADASITGEITTASGGLIAKSMTYAHTNGTNTSTMTGTWTANGSDTLPVTLAKYGLRSATPTLVYEDLLSSTVVISASGNSITNTHTITW